MKKIKSLIKVSLNHDMNLFKLDKKKQTIVTRIVFPLLLTAYIMFIMGIYSEKLTNLLKPTNLEFISLTIFTLAISFLTLTEGIYKSSSLLFNCKDDNLLLSLPVKKNTILFVRIFKFYMFELIYNSLFIIPSMIVYAYHINPGWTYYLSSFIALLLLPIVPIILSCIIGFIISYVSSKFKSKKIFETIITILFVLVIMYFSYNVDGYVNKLINKASSINDLITKFYYPVGAYISTVTDFKFKTLLIYILSHIILALVTVVILGKVYFKINSSSKKVLTNHHNKKYKIKTNNKAKAFVKKEINKFVTTPVFIVNAGFGLVFYIIICIMLCIKYDSLIANIMSTGDINLNTLNVITNKIPLLLFGLVCFSSLMTSITSSMISLEGKTFNILKSLPLKTIEIIKYKVITALTLMLPCILLGDLIVFIKFKFDILSILLILIASFILPAVSELIGILINLKFPKINYTNDTEVVKQSMSSLVATFIGMGLTAITLITLFAFINKINSYLLMLIYIIIYSLICLGLWVLLNKKATKLFNEIN